MSAKGCSPDSSAREGFFGRPENEFLYYDDWGEVPIEEFLKELDAYMHYWIECSAIGPGVLSWLPTKNLLVLRGGVARSDPAPFFFAFRPALSGQALCNAACMRRTYVRES